MKTLTATTRAKTSPAAVPPATAAKPTAAGRAVYAEATRWMPYVAHDAVAAATRTAWWPHWLKIATAEPTTLATPGDSADGALLVGGRPIELDWTVTRRLRDIVTLHATRDGHVVASLTISFARWHDGCVAELRLTCTAGSARRLRRALQRSLNDLAATVELYSATICPDR